MPTQLIILYGPPAAGKRTIAQALATQTGYRLFHNHLTLDPVNALFAGSASARPLLAELRFHLFTHAFQSGLPGIVFTYAYRLEGDDQFLADLSTLAARNGALCHLIQLVCTPAALEARVTSPERHQPGRTHDVATLRRELASADLFATLPGTALCIDTTAALPANAARRIATVLHLPPHSQPN